MLQVGGVPSDAAITDCLKPANEGQRLDGATTGTWGDLFEGTMLWRDQTLVFSSYPELPAVKLWSNRSITGLTGRLAELYQRILPNPTVALMADLPNKPIIDGIPKGADIVASVSVGDKVEVDFGLETLTVAEAIAFETEGKKQVADMLGASNEIINLGVVRDQKIVRLTGKLPPMILRVVANALNDTKYASRKHVCARIGSRSANAAAPWPSKMSASKVRPSGVVSRVANARAWSNRLVANAGACSRSASWPNAK